jgi:hypothetical protein
MSSESQDLTVAELIDIAVNSDRVQQLIEDYPIDIQQYLDIIKDSCIGTYEVQSFNDYLKMTPEILQVLSSKLNTKQYETLTCFASIIDSIVYDVFNIICDSD